MDSQEDKKKYNYREFNNPNKNKTSRLKMLLLLFQNKNKCKDKWKQNPKEIVWKDRIHNQNYKVSRFHSKVLLEEVLSSFNNLRGILIPLQIIYSKNLKLNKIISLTTLHPLLNLYQWTLLNLSRTSIPRTIDHS